MPFISKQDDYHPIRCGINRVPHITKPEILIIQDTLTNISAKLPNKRNIFLIDPINISNYEGILDYTRYIGEGYFIGQNTGGANGKINVIVLPSGRKVCFTGMKVFSNLGKDSYYYGVGIKPDLYVEETLDDILHGRDATLEKAITISN